MVYLQSPSSSLESSIVRAVSAEIPFPSLVFFRGRNPTDDELDAPDDEARVRPCDRWARVARRDLYREPEAACVDVVGAFRALPESPSEKREDEEDEDEDNEEDAEFLILEPPAFPFAFFVDCTSGSEVMLHR